jgi:hypothetical protein
VAERLDEEARGRVLASLTHVGRGSESKEQACSVLGLLVAKVGRRNGTRVLGTHILFI